MYLSTNELFHFTKFENLKLIIKSKAFLPRYNLEFTLLSTNFKSRAALLPVAMVCFCDIPYGLSKNHRERYGNHGIALTEEWKLRKGLNPIFYIQSESYLANVLADLTNITDRFIPIINKSNNDIEIVKTLNDIGIDLTFFTYFLKQFENKKTIKIDYEGKVRVFEQRKFYDEREWRYIPFEAMRNDELFITIWDYDNPNNLKEAHKRLENYKLQFDINDIKYLIVNSINEKEELDNYISQLHKTNIEIKIAND